MKINIQLLTLLTTAIIALLVFLPFNVNSSERNNHKKIHQSKDVKAKSPANDMVANTVPLSLSQKEIQAGANVKNHPNPPACLKDKKLNELKHVDKDRILSKCLVKYLLETLELYPKHKNCAKEINKVEYGNSRLLKIIIRFAEEKKDKNYFKKIKKIINVCGNDFVVDFEKAATGNFKALKDAINEFLRPKLRRLFRLRKLSDTLKKKRKHSNSSF